MNNSRLSREIRQLVRAKYQDFREQGDGYYTYSKIRFKIKKDHIEFCNTGCAEAIDFVSVPVFSGLLDSLISCNNKLQAVSIENNPHNHKFLLDNSIEVLLSNPIHRRQGLMYNMHVHTRVSDYTVPIYDISRISFLPQTACTITLRDRKNDDYVPSMAGQYLVVNHANRVHHRYHNFFIAIDLKTYRYNACMTESYNDLSNPKLKHLWTFPDIGDSAVAEQIAIRQLLRNMPDEDVKW